MKDELLYTSVFKEKKELSESKQAQLFTIMESLRDMSKTLKEADEANPNAIATIITKVEDLVVNAIKTLGVTSDTTSELIGTAGTLESLADEEAMIQAIDSSAVEADQIQEEFEPVYDSDGNIVNYGPQEDFMDDDLMLGSGINNGLGYEDEMMVDEYNGYESRQNKKRPLKKFKRD